MAKFEIPGAYLHIETGNGVIFLLCWALDDLMVNVVPKINTNYFIMSSKVKPLLYVQIKKTVYGLVLITQF